MSAHLISILGLPLRHYADVYIEYIKNVKARSPNTINAYLQDLNCLARFLELDDAHFAELNNECIISYLKYLRNKLYLKPATVRRRILTVQAFCQWLVDGEYLATNPFDDLELDLKVPKRLPRPVDPLTIRQLVKLSHPQCRDLSIEQPDWTACSRTSQRQTTLLVLQLILTTGIRVGEVSSIRIRDISSDGSTIHILGKGNKERLVYVENSNIANALSQYRHERAVNAEDDDILLVNTRGNTLTPQALRKRVKTMCLDIGTSDTPTPHRFRHSAATLLIENGVDIRVVQRLLGHASISTTELYTQVTDVSLREALRKADVLKSFQ